MVYLVGALSGSKLLVPMQLQWNLPDVVTLGTIALDRCMKIVDN